VDRQENSGCGIAQRQRRSLGTQRCMSGCMLPPDNAHEAARVQQRGVEANVCLDPPSRRFLRQLNFELMRSQQPTDRVDLVERSAQLSFRAWRREGSTRAAHVARGTGANNREERALWEP
jgi:hypothetical protein